MDEIKEKLDDLADKLKQTRDEVSLKIHLGKAEAKEEWDKLKKMKKNLDDVAEKLKQTRDEVSLKIHLGKAEAKEEREKLEKKWDEFQVYAKTVTTAVGESAKDIDAAMEKVTEKIKKGYTHIRDSLK
ncbi:MAG: hypothetical protein JRI32_04260 [Deltaproteobacteria bacterium]|nr:hypothetical protein [Deltaproteobacteria bacterium]MBW2010869.1 hypothetical protein [Deltaproteobacteria bacterium]